MRTKIAVVSLIKDGKQYRDADGESMDSRYYLPEDEVQMKYDIERLNKWTKEKGITIKLEEFSPSTQVKKGKDDKK